MRSLSVALALSASLAAVCPALAEPLRPFSVEDLVTREGLGQVRSSPDGRWVVVEHQGRHDQAAAFLFQSRNAWLVSSLEIHAVDGSSPHRRLTAPGHDAGFISGPFSPDGARMAVIRVTPTTFRLGVMTLETGAVDWLAVTPELSQFGRSLAWRSDKELIVMARPLDDPPIALRVGAKTQDRVKALWRVAASGHGSSGVYIPSGSARDGRDQPAPSQLLSIDLESGRQRVLALGEWFDMALSPDGRSLAALENAEDLQPSPDQPLKVGDPLRRRRLILIDLQTGALADPMPDVDLAMYLLSWSPRSTGLLVFGRARGAPDFTQHGRFWVIEPEGGARAMDLGEDRPWIELTWDGVPIPLGSWRGSTPLVQVRSPQGDRLWREAGTSGRYAVEDASERVLTVGANTLVARAGGLSRLGEAVGTAQPGRLIDRGDAADAGNPGAWNPDPLWLGRAGLVEDGCIGGVGQARRVCVTSLDAEERVEALAGLNDALITRRLTADGKSEVRLHTASGVRTLASANDAWRDVDWGQVRSVPHLGPEGQALNSWLLTPAGLATSGLPPVVVQIYPGPTLRHPPATLLPGSSLLQNNPAVLAGAGYAVLVANLPHPQAGARPSDLAARILAIVDAAADAGLIDRDRIALMGHSYGAYSALEAATQTDRFKAVIASSGYPDLTRSMELPPFFRAAPEEGVPVGQLAGWGETGQGGFGAFAANPQAYVDASPLFRVDRLTAPTLLVESDLDNARMGSLFGALYRLNREAALLTYYGEGHTYVSPGNLRDLYGRYIAWLEAYLGPPARRDTVGPASDPGLKHGVE